MISPGRVAIVTGAGSGIGKECASALAAEGAKVVALDINYDAVEATAREIADGGGETFAYQVDVTQPESVGRAFGAALERWQTVDILVHCAGILFDKTIKKLTPADWSKVMKVNGKGSFLVVQAACEAMAPHGYGRVILMSSGAWLGNFGQAAYGAAKSTVINLTRVAALEYARNGITVNAVAPGVVETPMTASMPPEAFDRLSKMIPVGRVAQPRDVVHVVLALADDDASYVTGQTILVDGGLTIGTNPA